MRVALTRWGVGGAVVVVLILVGTVVAHGSPEHSSPRPPSSAASSGVLTMPTPWGARVVIVHHPAHLGVHPALVVVLHGSLGSGTQADAAFGWDSLAERERFLVAYPSGLGRFWNAGLCCGPPHRAHVDDVLFLHRLITELIRRDGVDPARVYAVGFSNGAMMAYAWACERPGELAGIGVVAGALVTECPHPAPITVIAIHGRVDRSVPINGGIGPSSISHYRYPALAASLAPFLAADHCAPPPVRVRRARLRISTWSCPGGRAVIAVIATDLGHRWPGARSSRTVQHARTAQPDALTATNFLWAQLRVATTAK